MRRFAQANPDWLRHDLSISGPVPDVAALRQAAAGAGVIPWVYPDLDHWEEDQVHALVQPPDGSAGLSPAAARVLARQLRSPWKCTISACWRRLAASRARSI